MSRAPSMFFSFFFFLITNLFLLTSTTMMTTIANACSSSGSRTGELRAPHAATATTTTTDYQPQRRHVTTSPPFHHTMCWIGGQQDSRWAMAGQQGLRTSNRRVAGDSRRARVPGTSFFSVFNVLLMSIYWLGDYYMEQIRRVTRMGSNNARRGV